MKKNRIAISLLLAATFLFAATTSFADEVAHVKAAIVARQARWHAGETSMTFLSADERAARLGLVIPTTQTSGEGMLTADPPLVGAPASFDWRNNGGNFVTPVRNQGGCGSCWAFATTAALESVTLRVNNTPGVDLNLSEQVLVSCGNSGSCNGGYISSAASYIRDTGLPLETCYPYTGTDGSCSTACASYNTSTDRIQSWSWVTTASPTVDAIRNALNTYGPLVTTMQVYNDFFSYTSGVYSYTSGSLAGGHAVLIVGYDDPGQYFIVKNSWGTGWGEGGLFRIAYSELNTVVKFGQYTISYTGSACTYSISPASQSFTSSGGSGSVSVATQAACPWSVSNNSAWITMTAGSSGIGSGTVSYSVSSNSGSSSRSSVLTIEGQSFTVSESGQPTCTYSISPASQSFTASGGSGTVTVTTQAGCTWSVSNSAAWITITGGSGGTGSGTVAYTVSSNSGSSSRSSVLSIAGQGFTVDESGQTPVCTYSISPTNQSFSASGGSGTVNVTTQDGCTWSASESSPWIAITAGSSGTGPGAVTYSVSSNSGSSSRSDVLTVAGQTFTVNESGQPPVCTYSISPAGQSFTSSGGTGTVTVTTQAGCTWSASESSSWITITAGSSGTGSGTVTYSVSSNSGSSSRSDVLTAAGQTFTVTESGQTPVCTYSISPAGQSFTASGGTGTVSVTTQAGCIWSASESSSWITITAGSSGTGSGTVTYTVATNSGSSSRSDVLTAAGQTFTVNESGQTSPAISNSHDFNGDGTSDLIWHNQATGQLLVWLMNGTVPTSGTYITPVVSDTSWKVAGVGDFNADGKPDILWQNQATGDLVAWLMNGTVPTSGTWLAPSRQSDTNWKIVGIGDFNADGKPDILWQNQATGQLIVWLMNGTTAMSGVYLSPVVSDTSWRVAGVGDFNGDGKPDILWLNQVTGDIVVWLMNGTTVTSGTFITPSRQSDTNWKVAGIYDFNADGKPDILWQNQATGQLIVWMMNGTTAASGVYLSPTVSDTRWKIVGK